MIVQFLDRIERRSVVPMVGVSTRVARLAVVIYAAVSKSFFTIREHLAFFLSVSLRYSSRTRGSDINPSGVERPQEALSKKLRNVYISQSTIESRRKWIDTREYRKDKFLSNASLSAERIVNMTLVQLLYMQDDNYNLV